MTRISGIDTLELFRPSAHAGARLAPVSSARLADLGLLLLLA